MRNQLEDKKRQLRLKLNDEGMAMYLDYLNIGIAQTIEKYR